jgi:hypothetical protein
LFITIPGALIPAILVGSSGDASATALDPIAAWHWPGVLASDGYWRAALGGAMSGMATNGKNMERQDFDGTALLERRADRLRDKRLPFPWRP